MTHPAFRAFGRTLAALVFAAAAAGQAVAGLVVVGRIDPATGLAYEMKEVYISSFADGTPITKFAIGFSQVSNAWFFMRAGHPNGSGCRKELFRLVRISDNRLAIADPINRNLAWGVNASPGKIYPTAECISTTCSDCAASSDGSPAQTSLESPDCHCGANTPPGQPNDCRPIAPGLDGPYGPDGLVKKEWT